MKKNIYIDLHQKLLKLLYEAHSGHIGSCLSCIDILIEVMIFQMSSGDKFILSKGHAAPSLYVVLNHLKKITDKELESFHKDATRLPAHTPQHYFQDDIPFPTGSLGHGLSLASGIAHSYKYFLKRKIKNKVYCLISDGECNEGQVWEAAQYASHFKLSNLIVLLDKNKLQALGNIEDVLGDSASEEKWSAFGFEVFESDGHDIKSLEQVINNARNSQKEKPKIIIFDTVKGHGVSFMENKLEWHYHTLTDDQYKKAYAELKHTHEK